MNWYAYYVTLKLQTHSLCRVYQYDYLGFKDSDRQKFENNNNQILTMPTVNS